MTGETVPKPSAEALSYNPLSLAAYFVIPRFDKQELASATAFFVRRAGKLFLMTNWHVVSGRDPNTGVCLASSCAIPNNLIVRVHRRSEFVEFEDLEVQLFSPSGNPLWREHPTHASAVDVVAIEITLPDHLQVADIDACIEPMNEDTNEAIADDVFVIGYPFGLTAGDVFPIWKRATVASEPIVDHDDLPKMFLDTASRSGMSGSPVVLVSPRSVVLVRSHPQNAKLKQFSRNRMKLIGVYSGRIGADDAGFKAQLGIAWKSNAIDSIVGSRNNHA